MAVPTPVPCQQIESQLTKKRAELQRLNNTPTGTGSGPIFKPGRDRDPELEARKKQLSAEIKQLDSQLTRCFVQNTPNAPLTVRFQSLFCGDQDDTEPPSPIDLEDDEPYLLVYALNVPNLSVPVLNPATFNPTTFIPDARCFLIGRFGDVDSGDTVFGSTNVWDTNGRPQLITNPNSVFLFVAMMEEDATGADVVRTAVQTLMVPIVASNILSLAEDPEGFRFRMIEGLRGAIKAAVKPAVGSQDDLIGAIQEIRLTQPMLDRVRRFGSEPITLNFTSSDSRYSASFKLTR
jgi:hypothetical protein